MAVDLKSVQTFVNLLVVDRGEAKVNPLYKPLEIAVNYLADTAAELATARCAVDVLRHAVEMGYFAEEGSTDKWARTVLEAVDEAVGRGGGE